MLTTRLLVSFARRYPQQFFLTILFGFTGAFFNGIGTALIVPVLLKLLGQNVESGLTPGAIQVLLRPFASVSERDRLLLMTGAILLLIILKNAAIYISTLISAALKRSLTNDLREAGLKLLLEVDIEFYSKAKTGDLINCLNQEVSRAATAITTQLRSITTVLTIMVFVGLLIALSWQLTIASTVLLGAVALVNQYGIVRARQFGQQLSERSKAYSTSVLELLNGMRLVRSVANEAAEYVRIRSLMQAREAADFQAQANFAAVVPVSEVASVVALLLIVALGRVLLANQIESLSAVLLTYLFLLFRTLPLIAQLNGARSQTANAIASVEAVNEFLRRENQPFMTNGTTPFNKLQQGIRFNQVSFAYPNRDLVLQDINLYLPRGKTLALVGSSGAGKSTLADLLPRFYDPTKGTIAIDHIDIRSFDLKSLRRSMGIVSQDTFLFNASIRHNIAYGWDATEAEVIEAAQRANAYEFIEQLPQGLETQIGDRGILLSGGQRQRIAIARALLQNPEILILDEATSALDTVSERLVQQAIDELSRDRTTLVIAHRLSTVQKADRIAVLEQGQVVEQGTHNELLARGGYYARLCEMQFGGGGDRQQTKP